MVLMVEGIGMSVPSGTAVIIESRPSDSVYVPACIHAKTQPRTTDRGKSSNTVAYLGMHCRV
jgi:hypothetical protein